MLDHDRALEARRVATGLVAGDREVSRPAPGLAHDLLEPMVPAEDVFAFHMYLIRHGRQVCKAQRPLCHNCVMASECPSRSLFDGAGQAPAKTKRRKSRATELPRT